MTFITEKDFAKLSLSLLLELDKTDQYANELCTFHDNDKMTNNKMTRNVSPIYRQIPLKEAIYSIPGEIHPK